MLRLEIKAVTFEEAMKTLGYASPAELKKILNRRYDEVLRLVNVRTLNCLKNSNCLFLGEVIGSLLPVGSHLYKVWQEGDSTKSYKVINAGRVTISDLSEGLKEVDERLRMGVIMPQEEWYIEE